LRGVKEDSSSRLKAPENAVTRPVVSVQLEHGTPFIWVDIEGVSRNLILDTGSNISILQPGVSKSDMRVATEKPYGVTGETLDIKGRQFVSFVLNGREFNHTILVCSLPSNAAGLLGMDFIKGSGATIDFQCCKMSFADVSRVPRMCKELFVVYRTHSTHSLRER